MKNRFNEKWHEERTAALKGLLAERIVILDGAFGTSIQTFKLEESDFRGERFKAHGHDLRGNNDLLVLSKPEIIEGIHQGFLEAGSDMIETNTFNGTSIAQSDYGLESIVFEMNREAALLARRVADAYTEKTGKLIFVAGAVGPTNRTASMSPDVNNPGYRAVTFEELRVAYREQVLGLLEGGVDTLLVETIFDTLNSKAALFAIEEIFDEMGYRLPVQISVTITDAAGRTLSGQTLEAFWNSIAHVKPFSVGINCALGAEDMRVYVEELARIADCYVSCYPNAGLPNAFGEYDDTPEHMASVLGAFAKAGWLNIVGGCCGTAASHIKAIAEEMKLHEPHVPQEPPIAMRLSGLEAMTIG